MSARVIGLHRDSDGHFLPSAARSSLHLLGFLARASFEIRTPVHRIGFAVLPISDTAKRGAVHLFEQFKVRALKFRNVGLIGSASEEQRALGVKAAK